MVTDELFFETYTWVEACCSEDAPCEQNNSDPKKLGKAKKPDENLVGFVFLA